MENVHSKISLRSKDVIKFLARGIVKNVKDKKSLEIEAKIKKVKDSNQLRFISEDQFFNSLNQMKLIADKIKNDHQTGDHLLYKIQSQMLLSFSFESGHRLTFDASSKKFILETKEKNTEQNTIKVYCNEDEINISRKEELVIHDQRDICSYMEKLKKNEYSTVRIKVRKSFTQEFIQTCFSQVIQLHNQYIPNRNNLTEKQCLQQDLLVKIYMFLESYFNNKLKDCHISALFSACFSKFLQKQQSVMVYEIEVEMVDLDNHFTEIVKNENIQQIKSKVKQFQEQISSLISFMSINRSKYPVILGAYAELLI